MKNGKFKSGMSSVLDHYTWLYVICSGFGVKIRLKRKDRNQLKQ